MLERKTPPPFVHSTSFHLIKPIQTKLPNGIDLFFITGGSQDVVKLEIILRAGRWHEELLGAAHFTANLITKGTRKKNSFEIANIFDYYGAHVEVSPGSDHVTISIYSLSEHITPILQLLQEILLEPSFPEKEIEQHRSVFIQNLKVNLEKTSFLASKAFKASLFGAHHPYGRELEEADAISIQRDHLLDHYNKFYTPSCVLVSGKISGTTEKMIREIFSNWRAQESKEPYIKTDSLPPFHGHLEKEGSVQGSIRVGKRSLLRNHPDYSYILFVAHVLGGYFGSRLMKNIREEKGLTYGIYASVHSLRYQSYLVIGADVNKENIQLTLDEIRKEFKRLRSEKISDDELETAKNHFIGSLQTELTTPFAHADKIKTIYLFGLPEDYYQQMITDIDSISASRFIEISESHFNEDSISEVSVG